MNIEATIKAAKLGGTRKDAQIDTCSVFAAALYDLLGQTMTCNMVTVVKNGLNPWAHSVVEVDGRYYDSMGEFSASIYSKRAKIHPSVKLDIVYKPDTREECFEPEFDELYDFYLKMLRKAKIAASNGID